MLEDLACLAVAAIIIACLPFILKWLFRIVSCTLLIVGYFYWALSLTPFYQAVAVIIGVGFILLICEEIISPTPSGDIGSYPGDVYSR